MPYIKQEDRAAFNNALVKMPYVGLPGELNYVISAICHQYVHGRGGKSYATFNDVMGALDCAAREFYRTVVVPYEDKKRYENGSVGSLDEVK